MRIRSSYVVVAAILATGLPSAALAQTGATARSACSLSHAPGVVQEQLVSGQHQRAYRLFVPPGYDGRTRVPLVLDLPEARNLERYLPGESFDLMLALSWRYILSKNVLDRPTAGAINLHRGELPKFKGAEPVRRAIEAGATSVSITAHRMTEELDSGPILATVNIEMPPLPANITAEDYAEKIKVALYPLYAPLARLSILSLTSARQAAAKSYS